MSHSAPCPWSYPDCIQTCRRREARPWWAGPLIGSRTRVMPILTSYPFADRDTTPQHLRLAHAVTKHVAALLR